MQEVSQAIALPAVPPPVGGRAGAWAAWLVWAAMTVAGIWLALAHGMTMPFADDWVIFVPQMAGQEPVTLTWLWSQHNEHRLPLPRLIYLGLGWLTGYELRAATLLSALLLAGLSAALIGAARVLRGHTVWGDAYFPLAVQHWGSITNLLWGFQLCFVLGAVLGALCLVAVVRCRPALARRDALLVTLAAVGAMLCGGWGLPYLPAMAVWLLAAAILGRQQGWLPRRRDAALFVTLAGLMMACTAAYFLGYHRPPHHAVSPGLGATILTTLEVFATSLGPLGKELWPLSGIVVVAALAASGGQVLWVLWRRPEERVRALGFGALWAAIALLAVGIGSGRASFGRGAGLADRYIMLLMPLGCTLYLQWQCYCRADLWRHLQRLLLATAAVVTVVAAYKGMRSAREIAAIDAHFRADLAAGMSSADLALRHGERQANQGIEVFARWLEMLRQAGICDFRQADPAGPATRWRVRRLVELTQPLGPPAQVLRLTAAEQLQQPFSLEPGGTLLRLDLHLNHRRPRHWPDRLDWTLEGQGGDGGFHRLAGGIIDTRALDVYDYVALDLPDVRAPPGGRLRLVLSVPAEAAGRWVDVPLFAAGEPASIVGSGSPPVTGSLKAFLVTTRSQRAPNADEALDDGRPR